MCEDREYIPGYIFAEQLIEALGLRKYGVEKIVIECDVRDTPRVYIKAPLTKERCEQITKLIEVIPVKDVIVTNDGTVIPDIIR